MSARRNAENDAAGAKCQAESVKLSHPKLLTLLSEKHMPRFCVTKRTILHRTKNGVHEAVMSFLGQVTALFR